MQPGLLTVTKQVMPSLLTATEAAYIAGVIDGEGSLLLGGAHKDYPIVKIVMSDQPTIAWIAGRIGEAASEWHPSVENRRLCWRVQANGRAAVALLRIVRPYLITKAARADELLLWRPTRKRNG